MQDDFRPVGGEEAKPRRGKARSQGQSSASVLILRTAGFTRVPSDSSVPRNRDDVYQAADITGSFLVSVDRQLHDSGCQLRGLSRRFKWRANRNLVSNFAFAFFLCAEFFRDVGVFPGHANPAGLAIGRAWPATVVRRQADVLSDRVELVLSIEPYLANFDRQGLVHKFAGRDLPSARPRSLPCIFSVLIPVTLDGLCPIDRGRIEITHLPIMACRSAHGLAGQIVVVPERFPGRTVEKA